MWITSKFKDQYQSPGPLEDEGRRLATLPRGDNVELRVTLSEFRGRPFIALRIWERGGDGQLWPMKGRGCSIRLHELGEVIGALRSAEDLAGVRAQPRRDDSPRY